MRAVVYHGPGQKSWDEVPAQDGGGDDPLRFTTNRFGLAQAMDAYDTFARAGDTGALKVLTQPVA